jgi:hypothetical protein
MIPGRSSGRFTIPNMTRGEHHVAIGVGGVIRVVAPTYRVAMTQRAFTVVVPEIVAAPGPEALEFHLVTGPPQQPVLRPAAAEFAPIQGELDQALKRDPDSLSR